MVNEYYDNWENLANAVVERAAEDYRLALIKEHKNPENVDYRNEVESLERFFAGEGIKLYTKLDGVALMNRIKEQVVECNYSIRTIKKQCNGFT